LADVLSISFFYWYNSSSSYSWLMFSAFRSSTGTIPVLHTG